MTLWKFFWYSIICLLLERTDDNTNRLVEKSVLSIFINWKIMPLLVVSYECILPIFRYKTQKLKKISK